MKAKFLLAGLTISSLGISLNAVAEANVFVKCPTFIVDSNSGTYRRVSSLLPGSKLSCSNNIRALRRRGFVEEDSGPGITQNPILDTERVVQFRGETTIKQLFRVTSVARVVTAIASNCGSGVVSHNIDILDAKGKTLDYNLIPKDGSPVSFTIFNPGIYGIKVYGLGACDFQVTVL